MTAFWSKPPVQVVVARWGNSPDFWVCPVDGPVDRLPGGACPGCGDRPDTTPGIYTERWCPTHGEYDACRIGHPVPKDRLGQAAADTDGPAPKTGGGFGQAVRCSRSEMHDLPGLDRSDRCRWCGRSVASILSGV